MANLTGKGYANRGSVFTLVLPNGKKEVVTSNACRWEDVVKKGKYPTETKLEQATTYYLTNGKNKQATHVDFIWIAEGASHSGKTTTEYLLKIGAISQDQATAILNASTATL